jgi:CO/xanthine dehydrogenase FAD-binding subunit
VIAETNGANGSELIEIVRSLAMKSAKPLKTSASTMEYRRHMIGVLVKRSLEKLGVQL